MKNNLRYRVVFMCFILIVSLSACSLSKKIQTLILIQVKKMLEKL
ncbi:hypothetical protein SAMN04487761_14225 [Lachnospiraceae bacterium C7]|nr:hypothetical protein SAMN04487761_14225 [Lachnospiraceae bacterium C7]